MLVNFVLHGAGLLRPIDNVLGGTIDNDGTIENYGTIDNDGAFDNNDTVTNDGNGDAEAFSDGYEVWRDA